MTERKNKGMLEISSNEPIFPSHKHEAVLLAFTTLSQAVREAGTKTGMK